MRFLIRLRGNRVLLRRLTAGSLQRHTKERNGSKVGVASRVEGDGQRHGVTCLVTGSARVLNGVEDVPGLGAVRGHVDTEAMLVSMTTNGSVVDDIPVVTRPIVPVLGREDWRRAVSYTHLTLPTKRIV